MIKITAMTESVMIRVMAELLDDRMAKITEQLEHCMEHPEQVASLTHRYSELREARLELQQYLREEGNNETPTAVL